LIIREVELENILSHARTRVEFIEGINVIVGPNGAGKSSIIDGILLAILGACSTSREVVRANLDEILSIGSPDGRVRVVFDVAGRRYMVERRISRAGGRAQSEVRLAEVEGGTLKPLARGREEVCRGILSLLGVGDPLVVTSTIIARQGYLAELLDLEPSRRRERLLELAGLGKLEEAREKLREPAKKLQSHVSELEANERNLEKLRKEKGKLEADREDIERELSKLERRREELEAKLREVTGRLEELRRARELATRLRELEELRMDIESEEARVRSLEEELSKLEVSRGAESLVDRWVEARSKAVELRRIKSDIESLEAQLSSVESKLKTLGCKPAGSLQESIAACLDAIEREERELRGRLGALEGEARILERLVALGFEGDRCPLCGSPVGRDRLRHIMEAHRRRLEEIEREKVEIESRLGGLLKSRRELERLRSEVERATARLAQLKSEAERLREDVDMFVEECSKIVGFKVSTVEECPAASIKEKLEKRSKLEALLRDSLERLEKLRGAFSEEEYRSLRDKLAELGVTDWKMLESEIRRLESEAERLREELRGIERRLGELSGRLAEVERRLSQVRSDIGELEKQLASLKVKRRVLSVVELLGDRFLGKNGVLARRMTEAMREALEVFVNRVLEELGRDFRVRVAGDFNIEVVRGSERLSLESLSGGERTMLAIAFRLALASMLVRKPLSILVLDEPTEYLDENSRRHVFEVISRVAGRVDQVIVVTHDVEVEEIADRIIRVSKAGDWSRVEVEDAARA